MQTSSDNHQGLSDLISEDKNEEIEAPMIIICRDTEDSNSE